MHFVTRSALYNNIVTKNNRIISKARSCKFWNNARWYSVWKWDRKREYEFRNRAVWWGCVVVAQDLLSFLSHSFSLFFSLTVLARTSWYLLHPMPYPSKSDLVFAIILFPFARGQSYKANRVSGHIPVRYFYYLNHRSNFRTTFLLFSHYLTSKIASVRILLFIYSFVVFYRMPNVFVWWYNRVVYFCSYDKVRIMGVPYEMLRWWTIFASKSYSLIRTMRGGAGLGETSMEKLWGISRYLL